MLKVAYIKGHEPEKIKRVSAKQSLKNRMASELEDQYSKDAIAARKKYAPQIAEIEALEQRLADLRK